MQVSVEESGAIERKLTISIPSEEIESQVTQRLKEVARKAKVPGFRPGKVPQSIIKKRYQPQVTNEVINETINSSYMDALGKEKIMPAGLVSIDPTPYKPGSDFEYVATIELFPEIPCITLEGKTIEKPIVEVVEEDIDRTLGDIRLRNSNFVGKEGAAEKGDRLTIDFEGKIAGEIFTGGSAEDFQFVLGAGQMLEEFDKGLDGVSQDDSKIIDFSFPEDYGNEEIAGKDVEFSVSVKAVEKPELPELDDDFAKTLGIEEGGIAKMREEIQNNLGRELETRLQATVRDSVMDALFESNDIQVPKALVEEEIDRAVEAVSGQMKAQGLPADKIDRSIYAEESRRRVMLGLIAREIIEKLEINPDQDMIRAKVEEMAKSYEDSEAYINWHMSDPERVKQIEAIVIEEQIVEKMLETATVNEKAMSFKDFMSPAAAE